VRIDARGQELAHHLVAAVSAGGRRTAAARAHSSGLTAKRIPGNIRGWWPRMPHGLVLTLPPRAPRLGETGAGAECKFTWMKRGGWSRWARGRRNLLRYQYDARAACRPGRCPEGSANDYSLRTKRPADRRDHARKNQSSTLTRTTAHLVSAQDQGQSFQCAAHGFRRSPARPAPPQKLSTLPARQKRSINSTPNAARRRLIRGGNRNRTTTMETGRCRPSPLTRTADLQVRCVWPHRRASNTRWQHRAL